MRLKELSRRTEVYVGIIVIFLAIFIELRSGYFFTSNNFLDLMRAMIIPGMFGLLEYIVIVSGGVDVSFPSLAALSMYSSIIILKAIDFQGSIVLAYALCCSIGIVLGLLNGLIISRYRFPVLIVTLGTSSIFIGILFGFLGAHEIPVLPAPIQSLAKQSLFSFYHEKSGITGSLPSVFLVFVGLTILVWFVMNKTVLGRSIYAIGGDINSSERIGINVRAVHVFIYAFAGFIAGMVGMTRVALIDSCHPNTFTGMDMTVIAAVILGGTRASGGFGSITGVMLATLLLVMVNNSLQLMGIATYWQKFFLGMIIVLGTGISAYQANRKRMRLSVDISDEQEAQI